LHLGNIQRKPEDVRIGFAEVDEAGGHEAIQERIQYQEYPSYTGVARSFEFPDIAGHANK